MLPKSPLISAQSPRRHILIQRNTNCTTRYRGISAHETTSTQNMGLPCSQGLVPHLRGSTLPMHPCCHGRHRGQAHHQHLLLLPPHNTTTHHHRHQQDPTRNSPPHQCHCRHPGNSPRQNGSNPNLTSDTHWQNPSRRTMHTSPSSPAMPYHLLASRSRHTQSPSDHRT